MIVSATVNNDRIRSPSARIHEVPRQDNFLNFEHKRDQEGSVHNTHTSRSHSRVGSHVSQEQNNRAMQLEIYYLKKELRHARQNQTPSNSDVSSDDGEDASYR